MKKITAVNGCISDLIAILRTVQEDYCDLPVAIGGQTVVNMYWDEENGYLVLDDNPNLEEG